MKVILSALAVISMALVANAQNDNQQIERIERLTERIQRAARTTRASQSDLHEAISHLRDTLRLVQGNGEPGRGRPPGARPTPPRNTNYICVPRDDDGRAPYSIAVRDRDYNLVKSRLHYSTTEQCESAIESIFQLGRLNMLCGARDYDNRSPYAPFIIDGVETKQLSLLIYPNTDTCDQALKSSVQINSSEVVLCASRDRDSRAPFAIYRLNVVNGSVERTNNTFSSMSECTDSLR